MICRSCAAPVTRTILDLGTAPPSNAYLSPDDLHKPEVWLPLRIRVCEACWLVQTEDFADREQLFRDDYAYFSSFSSSWLAHAERYVADMTVRFGLTSESMVLEVAANDGYLLQYVKHRGIPCYGVEPTLSTAAVARAKGLEIISEFFGKTLASQLRHVNRAADLLVANNVFAHIPDINDFAAGIATILKPDGVATIEVAHILSLIRENQFDTVYHEHYSYWSLLAAEAAVQRNGLQVFDVELLPTHGGSLRLFLQRTDTAPHPVCARVQDVRTLEAKAKLMDISAYADMQARAAAARDGLMEFLRGVKSRGETVCGYGAAAKGNTLLNFAGVSADLLPFVVDNNPAKQGKCLPGSHIPVAAADRIAAAHPDWILILPWNIKEEIMRQLSYVSAWGGRFVTAIPELKIQPGPR